MAGSARLLSGREVADRIESSLRERIAALGAAGRAPGLAVVLVGDNPASIAYVGQKEKAAGRVGIRFDLVRLPATSSQADVSRKVAELNGRADVHGLIVQLPLPGGLDGEKACDEVAPAKDVDCLNPASYGEFMAGRSPLGPCTPTGVMAILKHFGVPLAGKRAVVVGRSNLVGRPLANLFLSADATVTTAHSKTPDLAAVCREADVLAVAVGRAKLVGAAHVKAGAVVVDVGINRVDGKLVGDVDAEAIAPVASAYTPVPGGVGPVTVAMLMSNTVTAAERKK